MKEAYAIFLSMRKLDFYINDAKVMLRNDHLPLKKFLLKNTLNTKVNNWAVEIQTYRIKFEYIKGIKNTLADMMSRLIADDPSTKLTPEPEGQEFGYAAFEDLPAVAITAVLTTKAGDSIMEDMYQLLCSREKLRSLQ